MQKLAESWLVLYAAAMAALQNRILTEQEMAWMAIRQPAIVRMLERDLAGSDTDALAVGLELTSQLLGELSDLSGVVIDRLSASGLAAARAQVAVGVINPQIVQWMTVRLAHLPVVLTAHEEAAIGRAIAAVTLAQTIG